MNTGVIIKVEVRLLTETDYLDLDVIPYSGDFAEPFSQSNAGGLYSYKGSFSIAKISNTNDTIIDGIIKRKLEFRVTDGNGTKHLVGDTSYPARLTCSREVASSAGGFNGYKCEITREAPRHTNIEV